jgi:cysteine desulfurase
MRSGTLNVPAIAGLGKACELCMNEMDEEIPRVRDLRDRLEKGIFESLDEVYINGHPTERVPTTTNLSFNYVEGESIMMAMKDVAVSSGSACTSASLAPSYVLAAMGVPEGLAHASLRFSLGRYTTEEEIDYVVGRLIKAIHRLREMSPLFEMAQKGIDIDSLEWTHEHHH